MTERSPLAVYIVDDDASIRDSPSLMLGLGGYATRLYAASWRAPPRIYVNCCAIRTWNEAGSSIRRGS